LQAAGIQPVSYLSAEDFLADDKKPQFDCLVLDVQLGGLSGIELNQQLAAAGSITPAIFITALDEPDTRAQALRTPCVAYIRKTEPAETVLAAVTSAIDLPSN
jgi:FixJ family two-component response regulator